MMATLPASYPKVPFLALIPGGLRHGLMIRITGEMLHHDRFNIDVMTGPVLSPSDDKIMHLSVRPTEDAIVRNHWVKSHKTWGAEERDGGCPIQFGQIFEILILAEVEQFKVAVNGRHFCEFKQRIPLSGAQYLHISGQVNVHHVKMEGDPITLTPSAPSFPDMSYQPPPYNPQPFQPPQYQQHPYQPPQPYNHLSQLSYAQPGAHGSIATSMSAVPSQYPSGQNYRPQNSTYLSNQPYQQYASYHTQQQQPISYESPKSGSGSNALKYAAGIGGIGLGAYVLSRVFDDDSPKSD